MAKIGVLGARGRMGHEVVRAVSEAPDLEVVAEVDQGDALDALTGCDVVVDFTHPGVVMSNLHWCVRHDLDVVVGTSGFAEDRLDEVRGWLPEHPGVRVLVVPNFSVGAILMMRFAAQAARYFPSAEVIELQDACLKVVAAPAIRAYIVSLLHAIRSREEVLLPASMREEQQEGLHPWGPRMRSVHPRLVLPRDFDLSPYFRIVKFNSVEEGPIDYRAIEWIESRPVDGRHSQAVTSGRSAGKGGKPEGEP